MAGRRPARKRQLPPEYVEVAQRRDRWYGLVILSIVAIMLVIALSYLAPAALLLELLTIPFLIYAVIRFAVLDQRSGRLLSPWLDQNPYTGPAAKLLNPMRGFAVTHGFPVGTILGIVALGLIVFIAFLLHRR
jgi:hypothetical protein